MPRQQKNGMADAMLFFSPKGKYLPIITKTLTLKTIDIAIQNRLFVAIRILIFLFYLMIF